MENASEAPTLTTGLFKTGQQFKSIFLKKFFYNLRNPLSFAFQMLIPTLYLSYAIYSQHNRAQQDQGLELSLNTYGNSVVTLLSAENGTNNEALVENYMQFVNRTGELRVVPHIKDYIFGLNASAYGTFKYYSVIGAHFTENRVLAMFSNQPHHSVPIALTSVYNAIIQKKNPGAPELLFINHPIPIKLSGAMEEILRLFSYYTAAVLLSFGLISSASGLCDVYVQERVSGVMNMQFISGLSPDLYWIFSFMVDLLLYGIAITIVMIVSVVDNASPNLVQLFQVIFMFGFAALPFGYLRSRRFKKSADLTNDLYRVGYLCLILYFTLYMGAIAKGWINQNKVEVYLMMLPHFNLVDGVLKYALGAAGMVSNYFILQWFRVIILFPIFFL